MARYLFVSAALLITGIGSAFSDTNTIAAKWLFWSTGGGAQTVYASNYVAINRMALPLSATRGSGLDPDSVGLSRTWDFKTQGYASKEAALLGSAYIELTLGPRDSSFQTLMSSISITGSIREGANIEVALFSSIHGFSLENQIGSSQFITSQSTLAPTPLTFATGETAFQSNPVTYRLYFLATNGSYFALGASEGFTTNNAGLSFVGEARTVPEPNVAIYIIAGTAIWGFSVFQSMRNRRRR